MIPRCPKCGLVVTRPRTIGHVAPWGCAKHGEVEPRWMPIGTARSRETGEQKRRRRRGRARL